MASTVCSCIDALGVNVRICREGGADRRPVVVLQVGKKGRLIGWIAATAER
jgi:hypothetical protein